MGRGRSNGPRSRRTRRRMWHDPIARRVGTAALAAVVLALYAAGRAQATEPTAATTGPEAAVYPELPNFHQVDSKLYRGGQPASGGVERLKSLGIRSIVNLRYERGLVKGEEAEAA